MFTKNKFESKNFMITLGRSEQMGPCACAYDLAHLFSNINALGTMFYSFWVSQLNQHLDPLTHVFKHTFDIIDTARLPTDCPYIPLLSLYTPTQSWREFNPGAKF